MIVELQQGAKITLNVIDGAGVNKEHIYIDNKEYKLVPVEEEKKPEWRILSFANRTGDIFNRDEDGKFYWKDWKSIGVSGFTEKELLKIGSAHIHSVEYKGEVFTVGDKVDQYEDEELWRSGIIRKFYVSSDTLGFYLESHGYLLTSNRRLEKVVEKSVLFTTEDGVEYTDPEDLYYYTNNAFIIPIQSRAGGYDATKGKNVKRFSTKEKALEWIEENKPKYSLEDIRESIGGSRIEDIYGNFIINSLKKLKK